jgi:predicted PurR-regulated permease PerM
MLSEGPLRTEIATTPSRADGLVNAVGSSILAAMIIAALYFGRDIFVPMALAILLTFVLAPAVHGLQGIHVPRSIAAVGVVLCAFACILALGSLFATQLNDLAGELPKYQTTISQKIQSLRSTTAGRGPRDAGTRVRHVEKSARGIGQAGGYAAPTAAWANTTGALGICGARAGRNQAT